MHKTNRKTAKNVLSLDKRDNLKRSHKPMQRKFSQSQRKVDINEIVVGGVQPADYILLGTEKEVTVFVPEKKELSHEYKKALGIIAIIAATAIITVLFITALGLLSRWGI